MVNDDQLDVSTALLAETSHALPTEEKFRNSHGFESPPERSLLKTAKSKLTCDKAFIYRLIPILYWLPRYDFKKYFLLDLTAGLTISVFQIPHGLAFAPLGGMPPVAGLYMAIFPIIPYVIFGTSPHLSAGMQAILIVMVGKIVETFGGEAGDGQYTTTQVAITATFLVGLWELVLGFFQLGCLSVLLSTSLVSGLTCGASIHVAFLQLEHIFGVKIKLPSGPLKLICALIELIKKIPETNLLVFGISIFIIIFLYAFNEYAKPRIAKKCSIPIPMEFIIACVGIGISSWLNLEEKGVKTVGDVPSGFPQLFIPSVSLFHSIAIDCLIIAVVNISINLSLVKVFAKRGNYEIRENQEILAYGASNVFGSFFQCLPVCAALSRSTVHFTVGGKTQIGHVVSLLAVLLVLQSLGPLFGQIPVCVLAASIIVAIKAMFMQITEFPGIWRLSKLDGLVWLSTFISVVLIDFDYGIGIGLAMSIIALICKSIESSVVQLVRIENNFLESKNYAVLSNNRVKLIKLSGAVNFYNAPRITDKILSLTLPLFECSDTTYVIVDLSSVPYVDPTGVSSIISLHYTIISNNCNMYLTNCSQSVYQTLVSCKFPQNLILVSLDAAVNFLAREKGIQL